MGEDKFLKVMRENVDKWMKAEPIIDVFGHRISTNPSYISILYKEVNKEFQGFLNGVEDEERNLNSNSGYSIYVGAGDEERGYGGARAARDSIPRDSAQLGNLMQGNLDLATKIAISGYLTFVGMNLVQKKDLFIRFSDEDVNTFLSRKKKKIFVNEEIRTLLKTFTQEMYEKKVVDEASATIYTVDGSKRFVDSEERKIRELNQLGTISFDGKFSHDNGQLLNCCKIMTFSDKVRLNGLEKIMGNFPAVVNELKKAVTPVSRQYPVIFSGASLGTMIHEALGGHLLSGKYIKEGISTTFKDRLNTQVLPEFMTLIDDPRLKGASGYYLFDDEGIASKRTVLIENGILKNYLLDRNSARYFGMKSNGHSRMEWVFDADEEEGFSITKPEPRVSNLEIISENCVSDEELEEIVKSYCIEYNEKCALYIESGAGNVNVQTSEFRMFPSSAYKLYSDGTKEPAHNFMIVGNAYELLNQIAITGDKCEVAHGICGSNSGGIPTQERAPKAFIPAVNIQAIDSVKYRKSLL